MENEFSIYCITKGSFIGIHLERICSILEGQQYPAAKIISYILNDH
jgi:hypothetical protein